MIHFWIALFMFVLGGSLGFLIAACLCVGSRND